MRDKSIVHSVFLIIYCLIQVISSFKLPEIGETFESKKSSYGSSINIINLHNIDYGAAKTMIGSFGKTKRQTFVPKGQAKEIEILHGTKRIKRSYASAGIPDIIDIESYKMVRIYLTMCKNLWSASYFGGSKPLKPDLPYPIVFSIRDKLQKLFSSISDDIQH